MKQTIQALKTAIVLLLVQLLCWQTCFGQVDQWEQVKLIGDGKKVSVKLHSGETVNGRAEGWTVDGLRVRQGKNEITALAKSDIAQVSAVTGMSRGRKALIGFMVGGVVGVTTMAIDCAGHSPGSVCGKGSDKPVVFALVGAIGALIAFLFPQHKRVIYTAPAR